MLLLTSITDLIQVVTDAAGDIKVHASYVDNATGVITPGRTNTASIVTATTTTVAPSPSASVQRNVKHLNLRNNHASQAVTCRVEHTDGTNVESLMNCVLLAGEVLVFDQSGDWQHYDANGGLYTAFPAADQTAMEAATSNTRIVTPLNFNWHPSTAKFWVNVTGNSTTINASWNMTSVTDGTSEETITIATDFSSANWCCQATSSGAASTAAAWRGACARAIAAGTIVVFCVDGAATTALGEATQWYVTGYGDQ